MPARRSRTTQWKRCLEQIHERGGSIEIAVASTYRPDEAGSHLVWRVRLVELREDLLVVEQPSALGKSIRFEPNVELIAIITIGQNRWMFQTTVVGVDANGGPRQPSTMRLRMPESVRRCQRRNHYRIAADSVVLPEVDLWPLLDPKTVVVAERANELAHERAVRGASTPDDERGADDEATMPEVGPRFSGAIVNIGGGGIGLVIPPEHQQSLARHRVFWLRFALGPELEEPICASAKLAHSHMQSDQHVYAGLAFDFSFNPGHQRFVIEQISRYIAGQQRRQLDAAA